MAEEANTLSAGDNRVTTGLAPIEGVERTNAVVV